MSIYLRVLLIAASLATNFYVLHKISRAQVKISDALYWVFFPICLLILSVFPGIAVWVADLLGVESAVNLVFLVVVFLLVVKIFSLSLKVSQLECKIEKLIQEIAIRNKENREEFENPQKELE